MYIRKTTLASLIGLTILVAPALAEVEDSVSINCIEIDRGFSLGFTEYNICSTRIYDPEIPAVTCHFSSVVVGGVGGMLSNDPSDVSISCRQTGPITRGAWSSEFQEVLVQSKGWNKSLKIQRAFDRESDTLVYVIHSTRSLANDSFKNVISTVPLWETPR